MYKILIVEDDLTIAEILKSNLCKWGYEAKRILDFSNVIGEFISYNPQLVVMDITLPFYNGKLLAAAAVDTTALIQGAGESLIAKLKVGNVTE